MALTRRQREVLDVIRSFIAQNGYSPSLEEIGGTLGLSSVATVHKHVSHLVDKGLVRRVWNQNRSIDLVDDAGHGNGSVPVPLMGTIAAGRPMEAIVSRETLQVPADMVAGRKGVYGLRVQGDSMIEEQIRDGDLVLVEQRSEVRDGETIVALVDGQDVTLKRLHREGPSVRLQPANPSMAPIVLAADRVAVQGVVVGVIRRYA